MPRFPMTSALLTMLACTCLLAMPALGELYKWTDAEGKVHYSDQPPPPNVKQPVTVKPRVPGPTTTAPDAAAPDAAAAKTYVEKDAEFNRRRVEAAEKEAAEKKAAAEAAEKMKNCEQAKAQLARVQSGARITRYNANGEPVYLNEAEIAQETERGKKVVDSWCK